MVISQLRFRKYLDSANCTNPVDVAAVARLPNLQSLPAQLGERLREGECDVLMIHREQGLIVGKIRSTEGGDFFSSQPESTKPDDREHGGEGSEAVKQPGDGPETSGV